MLPDIQAIFLMLNSNSSVNKNYERKSKDEVALCGGRGDNLLGASTRDPTHDKVMRRRPDKQGRSGLQGFRKAAPAPTLKMISVFLMLAILDYSLISVTQVDGLP